MQELCRELNIDLSECAFMGDDLPDLETMEKVGVGLTVPDATHQVLHAADWKSEKCGGQGAVREASDMILRIKMKL